MPARGPAQRGLYLRWLADTTQPPPDPGCLWLYLSTLRRRLETQDSPPAQGGPGGGEPAPGGWGPKEQQLLTTLALHELAALYRAHPTPKNFANTCARLLLDHYKE